MQLQLSKKKKKQLCYIYKLINRYELIQGQITGYLHVFMYECMYE